MKKSILLLAAFVFICCQNNKSEKSKEHIIKKENKVIKNEVIVVLKDSFSSLSLNVKNSPFKIKPDLLNVANNKSLVIPTDSVVDISINNKSYIAKGLFKKGDTVFISKKSFNREGQTIDYPYYEVSNRNVSSAELNFDYHISLKTPSKQVFKFYQLIAKARKIKNAKSLDDVYNNTLKTCDSFYRLKKISKAFFEKEIKEIKVFKAKNTLDFALRNKTKVIIDSLGVSLNDSTFVNNNMYLHYLIATLKYEYFFSKSKTKFKDLFDILLKNDKIFTSTLKKGVLNKLLMLIYISEKNSFEGCLSKLKTENYPTLVKKYNTILKKEKEDEALMASLKATGKLVAVKNGNKEIIDLKDALKKFKGKVVLVDFWASWCFPCRKEMPSLKKLYNSFDNSKFSIISISTDKNFSDWRAVSKLEKVEEYSDSYLLINADKSDIVEKFKIFTIPRYFLYDTNGVSVNSNAPKPSSKELKMLIEKYLKK